MAAGDPTHPATLFASFSARDAGERAASSRRAAAAAQLAAAAAAAADEDAHRLAIADVDPASAPVSDVAAQTDPPPPAPPRVVPSHDPPTVDGAAVVLGLLVVGVVACACVFPAQGARRREGGRAAVGDDARRVVRRERSPEGGVARGVLRGRRDGRAGHRGVPAAHPDVKDSDRDARGRRADERITSDEGIWFSKAIASQRRCTSRRGYLRNT